MTRFTKFLAAAALATLTFSATASADSLSQGVVIEPASYSLYDAPAAELKPVQDHGFKRAKIVLYNTRMAPGSIIVNTKEKALYYVLEDGLAAKYRVATAKPGFEWKGTHKVSVMAKWPDWRPPADMRKRRPDLPAFMKGGPKNPLGARAIYLGSSIYRIHGTNEPSSIGKAASSGCIRMLNEDVTELYSFVKKGATVTVL
jgi:lipoprotein-anchoring transpeptidase ErfK/SrfK